MKTVAHCATPFLSETGSWIYSQLASLESYRAVALTQEARNLEQYPVATLFTAESFGWCKSAANRLIRRFTGQYPFYTGVLRACQADLIHAHHGFQGVRCLRAKRRSALPMVTSFYGADATRAAGEAEWRAGYRRLFREGELFLAEGSSMAAQLGRIGCPEKKIAIHHLGVDLGRIPFNPPAPGERTRVLICASFREKKGIPDGIRAIARARERTGAGRAAGAGRGRPGSACSRANACGHGDRGVHRAPGVSPVPATHRRTGPLSGPAAAEQDRGRWGQ